MLLAGRQTTSGHQNDSIGSGEIVLEALRPAKLAEYVLMGDRPRFSPGRKTWSVPH